MSRTKVDHDLAVAKALSATGDARGLYLAAKAEAKAADLRAISALESEAEAAHVVEEAEAAYKDAKAAKVDHDLAVAAYVAKARAELRGKS